MAAEIITGKFAMSAERKAELADSGVKIEVGLKMDDLLTDPAPEEEVVGHLLPEEAAILIQTMQCQQTMKAMLNTSIARGLASAARYFEHHKDDPKIAPLNEVLQERCRFENDAETKHFCMLSMQAEALMHMIHFTIGQRLDAHHFTLGFRTKGRIVITGKRADLLDKKV